MATIKDVAKLAGVSVSTVSKTYNDYNEVSQQTKKKVLAAAEALNYLPNKSAVELSQGRRKYVGLIVKHSIQDEFLRMISGVHSKTEAYGYELVIYTTQFIQSQKMSYVDFCRYHSLIGAIVSGLDKADPYLQELTASETPCVLIDIELSGHKTAYVSTDNQAASYEVFKLLYDQGHRHICHITGSDDAEVTHKRKAGFLEGAKDHGMSPDEIIFRSGDWTEAGAYQTTKELLKAHPQITAIFAASDVMALGAMRAIREAGYTLGEDFALVGFDGIKTLKYTTPPIGTVKQGLVQIGELACDILFQMDKGQSFAQENYVPYKINPRGSVSKQ